MSTTTDVPTDLRAKTLRALHTTIQHSRRPDGQAYPREQAIVMMAVRYGSATRMSAARPDLDPELIARADWRRFNALQRLAYAGLGGAR